VNIVNSTTLISTAVRNMWQMNVLFYVIHVNHVIANALQHSVHQRRKYSALKVLYGSISELGSQKNNTLYSTNDAVAIQMCHFTVISCS